jgi:hypothetical protein
VFQASPRTTSMASSTRSTACTISPSSATSAHSPWARQGAQNGGIQAFAGRIFAAGNPLQHPLLDVAGVRHFNQARLYTVFTIPFFKKFVNNFQHRFLQICCLLFFWCCHSMHRE